MPSGDQCEKEMFVTIRWGKDSLAVPLSQLKPISNTDAQTREAIGDWHYWVSMGYQLRRRTRSPRLVNPIAIDHRANAGLRHYFEPRHAGSRIPALTFPHQVVDPYHTLGTHPDLVARLWDELASGLPLGCCAIVYGVPALMHPSTSIVFGFATGTHTYALRLPKAERADAIRAGATRVKYYSGDSPFNLDDIGPEWVFCGWFKGENAWCLSACQWAGAV